MTSLARTGGFGEDGSAIDYIIPTDWKARYQLVQAARPKSNTFYNINCMERFRAPQDAAPLAWNQGMVSCNVISSLMTPRFKRCRTAFFLFQVGCPMG